MIGNAIKAIRNRQQSVSKQIKSLQAEAGKLEEALRVLATLGAGVVTGKAQPRKIKKRRMSAAGRRAIAAAAKARWAKLRAPKAAKAAPAPVKKRKMSAAGRRAIAAAAKLRWKLYRAKGAKAATAPGKKRRLSAAGRKAIIAGIKARWAKIRAAQK